MTNDQIREGRYLRAALRMALAVFKDLDPSNEVDNAFFSHAMTVAEVNEFCKEALEFSTAKYNEAMRVEVTPAKT